MLQFAAIHCKTPQNAAKRRKTPQCNSPQFAAKTPQFAAKRRKTRKMMQFAAICCKTPENAAICRNSSQNAILHDLQSQNVEFGM
jgi:hypothetical protein